MTDLQSFKFNKHFRAESGHLGSSNQKTGRNGEDCLIRVPCGTTILNKKNGLLIRDLVNDGDEVIALSGGRGGRGNHHHDREATPGENGQILEIVLTLKIGSDICLVGNPNAGKSSLLNFLTGSKVKAEAYPFSTKTPQLGIYETPDYQMLTLCELPALAHDAHKGKGLGNQFLKHVSRAKLLFLMMDPFQDAFEPEAEYNAIINELKSYNPDFAELPHFAVVNKVDSPSVKELQKKKYKLSCPLFFISAQTGEGVERLMKEAQKVILHETRY